MDTEQTIHQGKNVRFFREIRKMKQDVLADALGISQSTLSRLELQEKIEDATLEKIAKELDTSAEIIKNLDQEKAINIVSNTFQDGSSIGGSAGSDIHYNPTFNPIDKVVELYDQIIHEKDEKFHLLEQLLQEKK